MAILKAIKGCSSSKGGSKGVLKYVGEKAVETDGWHCSNDYQEALRDFQETKTLHNKPEGRQYKHYVVAFKEHEIDKKGAMEITKEFIEKTLPDHEVFIALHNDKGHLHTHLIVNSVSIETGKKLHESSKNLQNKKDTLNEICLERGLEIPDKSKKQGKISIWDKNKYKAIEKGARVTKDPAADNYSLVLKIENAISSATSKEDFIKKMEEDRYEVTWKDNNKNVTFTIPEEKDKPKKKRNFRLKTLGKDFNIDHFTKEGLEDRFKQNLELKNRDKELKELENQRDKLERDYRNTSKFNIFKRKDQEKELEVLMKKAIEKEKEKTQLEKEITLQPDVGKNIWADSNGIREKYMKEDFKRIKIHKYKSRDREKDRGMER